MGGYCFAIFDTAIGPCGVAWGDRGIHAVQLPMGSQDKTRNRIRQRYGDISEAEPTAQVEAAIDGMVELLAGKPNDLREVVLDLEDVPAFNRGVYDIARAIPPGKTLTYGDIAKNSAASNCRATSARRSGAIPVRSWCLAIACSRPATDRAASPPMAAW